MLDPVIRQVGVITAVQLTTLGWGRVEVRRALRAGRLTRVRDGWYARSDANPDAVEAVSSGGCLSCASALALRGAWMPEALRGRHVRVARRSDARGHGCRPHGPEVPVRSAVDDIETAFRALLRCASPEEIVVVADSLLHLRLASSHELESWSAAAPARVRAVLAWVDVAESGIESIVRIRLRRRGVCVRTQVWIGSRRVDLLVGDRLVIECDGAEHHGSWDAHSADRARDRALTAQGFLVVRLTYRQIVDGWDEVEQDLLALIRRDAHRSRGTK